MDPVENFIDSDTEGEQEPLGTDSDQSLTTESSGSDYETEDEDEDEDQECVECKDCNPLYGKDKTKWSSVILHNNVKTATTYLPDTTGMAKEKKTPLDCWLLFFTEEMLNDIVNYTNTKIATKASNYSACYRNMVKETNLCELKALLGLVYLSGMYSRARYDNDYMLWSRGLLGIEFFPKTMSRERFSFLLQCLRFDDINDRAQRRNTDKLAPIRQIYDKFLESSQSYYNPSEHLILCKKLEPFEGRSSFLQCSSKNTDKHGLKIFTLIDIKTYYYLNMEVYVNQPDGIYRKSNRRSNIVERLIAPVSGTNRNITFDKWFTSYSLMMTLLKTHKLTSVGAVKKKEKEIPKALLRRRKTSSSVFAFQKDITAVSYMATRTTNIVFFSTLHHDSALINKKFPPKLPKIIDFYDSAEYKIYKRDESLACYDVTRNTRRWPLMLFFTFLNMAAVNAHIIYTLNKKVSRKKVPLYRFVEDLVRQLTNEYKELKSENPCCSLCPDGKDYKAAYSCEECGTSVCSEHVNFMCKDCDCNKSTSDDV